MNYFKDEKYDLAQALMSLVLGMLTLQLGLWAGRRTPLTLWCTDKPVTSSRSVPVHARRLLYLLRLMMYPYELIASDISGRVESKLELLLLI